MVAAWIAADLTLGISYAVSQITQIVRGGFTLSAMTLGGTIHESGLEAR
jgi:hypothetical protein